MHANIWSCRFQSKMIKHLCPVILSSVQSSAL